MPFDFSGVTGSTPGLPPGGAALPVIGPSGPVVGPHQGGVLDNPNPGADSEQGGALPGTDAFVDPQEIATGRSLNEEVLQQLRPVTELRQRFQTARHGRRNRILDTRHERGRVGNLASAFAAQQPRTATTAGGTLREALRIGKARTGVVNRGERAVENQNLKDRLTEVRSTIGRRAQLVDMAGKAAQIREGVNVAVDANRAFADASKADLVGGVAGGITGVLAGNKQRNGSIFDFGKKNPVPGGGATPPGGGGAPPGGIGT